MKSLRAKLALLLVVAIVAVVTLATAAVLFTFRPPHRDVALDVVARQIASLAFVAENGPIALDLRSQPVVATPNAELTENVRNELRAIGAPRDIVAGALKDSGVHVVDVPVAGGRWLTYQLFDAPPRGGVWKLPVAWAILITLGVGAISVFVVRRMIQPVVVLEDYATRIGADGVLPALPEKGPPEIRAMARAINGLSARLAAAMESRMRLVAAAGHDLRTPITRLRLRAEFLEEDERTAFMRDLDELEHIADSAIMLVRLESEQAAAEALPLDELVSEIAEELTEQNFSVHIEQLESASITAPRVAMKRAVRNLIINAATHGAGARVSVVRDGDRAKIVIVDSGPGIPHQMLGRVFEPFFRADPARRQAIPGAGLGLSIANEIVRRAGGTIEIGNRPEGGLRQVVELPVAEAEAA